jgi:hypothetical protein
MGEWDDVRYAKTRRVRRSDLVLVDANPRLRASHTDLATIPHRRKASSRMIFVVRNIRAGSVCLTDERSSQESRLTERRSSGRSFVRR